MSEELIINWKMLEDYRTKFKREGIEHTSNAYNSTFSQSILKTNSNSTVQSMGSNLLRKYLLIHHGYRAIGSWWSSYNKEVSSLENALIKYANLIHNYKVSIADIFDQRRRSSGLLDYSEGDATTVFFANMAEEFINIALAEVGYKERKENRTKYGEWFDWNGVAWCAIFVSWVIWHTEFKGQPLQDIIPIHNASTSGWAKEMYEHPDIRTEVSTHYGGDYIPQPGDIVMFSNKENFSGFPGKFGDFGHIGIAVRVEGNILYVVEGNSNDMVEVNAYSLDPSNPESEGTNGRRIAGFGVWY